MIVSLKQFLRPDGRTSSGASDQRRSRRSAIGLHMQPGLISAAQLSFRSGGPQLQALAQAELPLDADEETTAAQLRGLLDSHPFSGSRVVSLVGVQDLCVQSVRVPNVSGEELDLIVRSEAQDRLPIDAADAEIRYLSAATVRHDDTVRKEILLMACPRPLITRQVDILKRAGLSPAAIDLEPAATLRALAPPADNEHTEDGQRGVLTFSRDSLTLTLVESGRILFVKHLAGGGTALDRAIADAMDFPQSEARRLRLSVARCDQLDPTDDVHRALVDALERPLDAMIRELELCVRYHKITFRQPLTSLQLAGCDAAGWVADYISRRLGRSCELASLGTEDGPIGGQPAEAQFQPTRWIAAVGAALRPRQANHATLLAGNANPVAGGA